MTTNRSTKTNQHDHEWIRGVNLGGWFVLERFINPYFFALTDCHIKGDFRFFPQQIDAPPPTDPNYKLMDSKECTPIQPYPVDQWTLTSAFQDKNIAREYMKIHWENFITREDLKGLKQNTGVTHLRVPLGHWIMGDIEEGEPWVDGEWPYFQRLVQWCREEGLQIWPDIHTAPGSQNGFDNSGRLSPTGPTCHGWDANVTSKVLDNELPKNVLRSLKAVEDVTAAIAREKMTDVVTGFGVLNEPFVDCNIHIVKKFDNLAYKIVKKNMGKHAYVYIPDLFNATKWNGFWNEETYMNTLLDSHYYHVFDERPRHLSPKQHIALVCQHNQRQTASCCYSDETNKHPSVGLSRLIGEWSASFDTLVCDKLDVVMAGIAANGTAPELNREIEPERKAFLRNFVEAQMVTFEAADIGISKGWFYWTFKMEGGAFAEWDFLRGIKEGWIPRIPSKEVSSTDLYGTCYDIIFKTNDDMSIIHEFPDPNSIDLSNWQGFDTDDDVVLSHGDSLKVDHAHPKAAWNHNYLYLLCGIIITTIVFIFNSKKKKRKYYTPIDAVYEMTV